MAPTEDAVTAVATRAVADQREALRRWEGSQAGGRAPDVQDVEAATKSAGRLTLNFHPDRIARSGNTVAAGEHELFEGAYAGADPDAIALPIGDSHTGPSDVGTFDSPWSVLAGLAEEADSGAVLSSPCDAVDLLELLAGAFPIGPARRELDNYVEIQVHGGVDLGADVDVAVLDPSFRGTAIHDSFETMASTYGVGQ